MIYLRLIEKNTSNKLSKEIGGKETGNFWNLSALDIFFYNCQSRGERGNGVSSFLNRLMDSISEAGREGGHGRRSTKQGTTVGKSRDEKRFKGT